MQNLEVLRSGNYYFGEYITQGRLDISGPCTETTLQDLIDNGLYELAPCFEVPEYFQGWANPVVAIRNTLRPAPYASLIDIDEIRLATELTEACFGDEHWVPAIMPQLLAMKKRPRGRTTWTVRDNGKSLANEWIFFPPRMLADLCADVLAAYQSVRFGPEAEFDSIPELQLARMIVDQIGSASIQTQADSDTSDDSDEESEEEYVVD